MRRRKNVMINANFRPSKELTGLLIKNKVVTQAQVMAACDGIWAAIPAAFKSDDLSNEEINALLVENADAYFAAKPNTAAAAPKKTVSAQAITNFDVKASQYSMEEIAAIQSEAANTAIRDFDNNYLKGLEARITKVYTARPSAKVRLDKVTDFIPDDIEDADKVWADWEKQLPAKDVPATPRKGQTLAPDAKPKINAAENRKAFETLKAAYSKKERLAVHKSTSPSPICGIEVSDDEGVKYIPTQQQLLALALVSDYGGQIGHVDDKETLSATVSIYQQKNVVGNSAIQQPKVVGQVKGLAKFYSNNGTAEKLYVEDKSQPAKEVKVQSAISFKIAQEKDGKTTYKIVRLKGTAKVPVYSVEEAKNNPNFKEFFSKGATKAKSTTKKSNVLSTNGSNADIQKRMENRDIVAKIASALAVTGAAAGTSNAVLFDKISAKYGMPGTVIGG
jgi:hypothetical protein